jgi:indole-3-glycerol phosphate synthase
MKTVNTGMKVMKQDFLKVIVDHKKKEIEESKKGLPEDTLRKKAKDKQYTRRFFHHSLKKPPSGIHIIAEIKRASPSKGDIHIHLDPSEYARKYEQGGAAAISVLTDTHFFKGSFEDFKRARNSVTLPVLRKDFLISSYQIYESVLYEADAVLLIARILSQSQLSDYLSLCKELSLDALVEVHSEQDLENATIAGAELIGINNRDLSSFDTDIRTAMEMMKMIQPHQTAVAASGIRDRDDIIKSKECGIHCFLIGESVVRADNPSAFISSLLAN